jgi:hypothetical protein
MCPKKSSPVRASTIISGYYIRTISKDPVKSVLCTISQTDLGGLVPAALVNTFAAKAPKDWVNNLKNGLKLLKEKKLI